MRYIFILIILAFLVSCHKAQLSPGLIGKWNLERTGSDGIAGPLEYRGPSRILKLQSDNKYIWYNSFSAAESGIYSVNIVSNPTPPGLGPALGIEGTITFTHGDTSYQRQIVCYDRDMTLYDNSLNASIRMIEEFQKIF